MLVWRFHSHSFCECCAGDKSRALRYIQLVKEMLMLAASKGTRLVLDDRDMRGDALEFQARLGSPKEAESAQILTVNRRPEQSCGQLACPRAVCSFLQKAVFLEEALLPSEWLEPGWDRAAIGLSAVDR